MASKLVKKIVRKLPWSFLIAFLGIIFLMFNYLTTAILVNMNNFYPFLKINRINPHNFTSLTAHILELLSHFILMHKGQLIIAVLFKYSVYISDHYHSYHGSYLFEIVCGVHGILISDFQ